MNNYIYIAVMAAVSYTIRVLPLTLIRKPIKNQFIQSFLYYVPYVTLAVMTFPAIIHATQTPFPDWWHSLPVSSPHGSVPDCFRYP
jgi:branched-subunit amino acid transport protein